VAVLDRHLRQDSIQLDNIPTDATLDILVENNGRINYGPYLTDNRQGITEKTTLGEKELTGWQMFKLPYNSAPNYTKISGEALEDGPVVFTGAFNLTKTGDTYLDMSKFGKGFVFLNGHNLGKYWYIGPQQTLYVPKSWLKVGQNEIVIFDQLKAGHTSIQALDKPVLNTVVKAQQ